MITNSNQTIREKEKFKTRCKSILNLRSKEIKDGDFRLMDRN